MAKRKQTAKKKRTGHIVSHTHWDREWRYPMWQTRVMLCDLMDELIEVLEKGIYPAFLLDGQVIPVMDYLVLRPEMTERVKKLVKAGKLQIGPWLTLPDEYPVDGEALVRNLLVGARAAKDLGGNFNVGYTTFGWGQTAQLPQIYAGFAMDTAFVGKFVNSKRAPKSEFLWKAPDGSTLLCSRFGEDGRANFYFQVHLSILFGIDHKGHQWVYDWENGGIAYHCADGEHVDQDFFRLDAPRKWYPQSVTPQMLDKVWQSMDSSLLEDDRVMMNGTDYILPQKLFPQMLKRLNEVDKDNDRQWVHTSMADYIKLMKKKLDRDGLVMIEGELRDGPVESLTGNALTTRVRIKRLNKKAQNMLIGYAEPMAVLAEMAGADYPRRLLDTAWDFLLKAHPHDSINGVTQDKTVEDNAYRLNQVIELSDVIGQQAQQHMVKNIDMSNFSDDDVLLTVFNPMPYERREVIEAYVNMPDMMPRNPKWCQFPPSLMVYDANGKALSTQCHGATSKTCVVSESHMRPFPFNSQKYRIFFDTGPIPAGGYKVYKADFVDLKNVRGVEWADAKVRTGSLLTEPNVLENEYLKVSINCNGTFDLVDKQSKKTYENLGYFSDRGELGDYWINQRPDKDQYINSLGCQARIWAEDVGPLKATLVSEISMQIPVSGDYSNKKRSENLMPFTIKSRLTLKAYSQQVDVEVALDNPCSDHYLKMHFPTSLSKAKFVDSGGHFIVDRRPIRPQGPTQNMVWPDMATRPMNDFVDLSDGANGIAFLTDSIFEYEVSETPDRTVGLSLLRAVRNWIAAEYRVGCDLPSQKGGQQLGYHTVRLAIRPHQGTFEQTHIPLFARQFNIPLRIIQTRKHNGDLTAGENSWVSISNPDIVLSALKKAQDRNTTIIRMYNSTDKQQRTTLKCAKSISKAWRTDLNEKRSKPLDIKNSNMIGVAIEPYKIETIEIRMK